MKIPKFRPWWRGLSRTRRFATLALVTVATYALLAGAVLPAVLEAKAPAAIADSLGREVEIEDVAFNPFTLALTVRGLRIGETASEDFVRLGALHVDLEASSLFRRALTLREIRIVAPVVRVAIAADGTPSFADIVERFESESEEAPAPETGAAFPLIIDLLAVEHGRFVFRDESRRTPFEEEISPIDFAVADLTTIARDGEPSDENSLSIYTESGAELLWAGSFSIAPLRSAGQIHVKNFRSRTPWRYLRDDLGFETTGGTISLDATYRIDASGDDLDLEVSAGQATIESLTIFENADPTHPRVVLPHASVRGLTMSLRDRRVEIPEIASSGVRVRARREADGRFSILALFAETTEDDVSAPAGADDETSPDPANGDENPWEVTIEKIDLADWGIAFTDQSTPTPFELVAAPITLSAAGLSTAPDKAAAIDLAVAIVDGGTLRVAGNMTPGPSLEAELDLTVEDIALSRLQPYLEASSAAVLRSGTLSAKLAIEHGAGGDTAVQSTWLSGDLSLAGLDVGTRSGRPLFRALRIDADGLELSVTPVALEIASLRMTGPETFVHLLASGQSNITEMATAPASDPVPPPQPQDGDAKASEPGVSYRIAEIAITDGAVRIRDENFDPPFRLGVTKIAATVENVASEPDAATSIDLRAKVGTSGALTVDASAKTAAESIDGTVAIELEDFDTVALSPYSGRYVARRIARGRLGLDLDYAVERSKLEAKNKIRIDSLTLGKRVPSPDATDLPVDLALVLLKDTKGRIALDVPVKGRLDDPEFRIGGVILGTLRDLILKATTAPFSLIGGLVAGGEDLGILRFTRGRHELGGRSKEKLDKIALALAKKPELRLDVPGIADPELDVTGLREAALEDELKAMRFEELRDRSRAPATPDQVQLDKDLRDRLVAELYAERFDESERSLRSEAPDTDEQGREVDARRWAKAEMRRRLTATTPVDEAALERLASARAEAIVTYLTDSAGVAPERVAAVEPSLRVTGEGNEPYIELILTTQ